MIDDRTLLDLKLQAFEAASRPQAWQDFLERLRGAFGASAAALRATPPHGSMADTWWVDAQLAREAKQGYSTHWGRLDPWFIHPLGHRASTAGRCFVGSEILPWAELESTEFYNEFGRDHGLKGVLSGLVEDGSWGCAPPTKLALYRGDGLPEFSATELEAFRSLQPAFRRALHHHWALRGALAAEAAVEEAFDGLPVAMFVVDANARLLHMNPAALEAHRNGFVRMASGRLSGVGQLGEAALSAHLRAAAGDAGPQELNLWIVTRSGELRTFQMRLIALGPEALAVRRWPQAHALLTLYRGEKAQERTARLGAMARVHGLTAVESRVMALLVDGLSPQQAAPEMGIRLSTMRTHIRHLLEKTQVRRVVDLVRKVGE